jgi:hypothetical protein
MTPPDAPRPRLSRSAVVAFVLGLASPFAWALAGIPALVLGLSALRGVHRSDGGLRGRRLAIAGMVLGGLGVALTIAAFFVVVVYELQVRAARGVCLNNLRQIGLAARDYADERGEFPPAVLPYADLPPERSLSWLVALPPYSGEKGAAGRLVAIYDRLDQRRGWEDEANAFAATMDVRLFRCPGDPRDPRLTPGLTNYVGIAGEGVDAAWLPASDPRTGVFGYFRQARLADFTAGTSRTLFAAESGHENGPWTAGGPPTVRGVDPADSPPIGPGRPFGGMHPNGLNVLWSDASADFRGASMSAKVFADSSRIPRSGEEAAAPEP